MADENFAILVGIARYKGRDDYPPLDGPRNDVAHIRKWLVDPNGGNVKRRNIHLLTTPRRLFGQAPPAGATEWTPDQTGFRNAYEKIVTEDGEYVRRDNSRLYLYFSGHGFSLAADTNAKAALFAANAIGIVRPNIPGTVYAEAVKRVALFKEIVLIMDCCRDVQRNITYGPYELDQTESGNSQKVRLFSIYASAKNGKAQEREFGTDGKVYGLLTCALVRALDEAPTNVLGQVSSTSLNNYLRVCWDDWCPGGDPKPTKPRTVPDDAGDIYFNSRKPLVSQQFAVGSPGPAVVEIDSEFLMARGKLAEGEICWQERNDPQIITIPFGSDGGKRTFSLKLPPCTHTLSIFSAAGQVDSTRTFVPEADHVIEF